MALLTLVVLEELHAFEGSGTGDELVGELALIVGIVVASILVIDLLVASLRVV